VVKVLNVRVIKAETCEVCGTDTIRATVCEECCTHDERDHGICLDCGQEDDGSADIDRAMDTLDMMYN
jgi:ribosomal protein L32